MSLPRTYAVSDDLTLEELGVWINQIEDITVARITEIKAAGGSPAMTHLVVDLDQPRPEQDATIQLGHSDDDAAINGQAWVSSEKTDVFISR